MGDEAQEKIIQVTSKAELHVKVFNKEAQPQQNEALVKSAGNDEETEMQVSDKVLLDQCFKEFSQRFPETLNIVIKCVKTF